MKTERKKEKKMKLRITVVEKIVKKSVISCFEMAILYNFIFSRVGLSYFFF
jgi:hypothetical protein